MKIPKIQISNKLKYTLLNVFEGLVIIVVIIAVKFATYTREPKIIKTVGVVSKLELIEDKSSPYVQVYLNHMTGVQFNTNLVDGETLHLNHQYVFFTKNNVILYHTDNK